MQKKYVVRLSQEERVELTRMTKSDRVRAFRRTHAQVLLLADESEAGPSWPDQQVAQATHVSKRTVENIRQRLVEQGLSAALERKKRETPPNPPKLTGETEARIIALACSSAPEGRSRWTLQLLADKLVELNVFDSVSTFTVRKALKKTNSSRTARSAGAFRPGRMRSL